MVTAISLVNVKKRSEDFYKEKLKAFIKKAGAKRGTLGKGSRQKSSRQSEIWDEDCPHKAMGYC